MAINLEQEIKKLEKQIKEQAVQIYCLKEEKIERDKFLDSLTNTIWHERFGGKIL